jgi:hypothetical protein
MREGKPRAVTFSLWRITSYREQNASVEAGPQAIRAVAARTWRHCRAAGVRVNFVDKQKLRVIFGYQLTDAKTVGAGVAGGEFSKSYLRAAHNPVGPFLQAQRETE